MSSDRRFSHFSRNRQGGRTGGAPRRRPAAQWRGGVRDRAQFHLLENCDIFFLESRVRVTFSSSPFCIPGTVMDKPSKKSRCVEKSPPALELAPRLAPRRASAEQRLRILERLADE